MRSAPWSTSSSNTVAEGENIFVPIAKDDILCQIPIGRHHPVKKLGIEDNDTRTLHTNKFYANFFLGNQDQPVWTHPYLLSWAKGVSRARSQPGLKSWGMAIDQTDTEAVEFAPGDPPVKYYSKPLGHDSIILSAQELGPETILTIDTILPFSVNVNLRARLGDKDSLITIPCVQGMAFVTGGYRNATPLIQSGIRFKSWSRAKSVGNKATKYRAVTSDGNTWLIYICPTPVLPYDPTAFKVVDNQNLVGPPNFTGTIQIAKNPLGDDGESVYDKTAGTFATEATVTGQVDNERGIYTLNYTKVGKYPLLIFALPHHIESLSPDLKASITKLRLRTTTKGLATALFTEKLTMIEPTLPTTMSFGPWAPWLAQSKITYSLKALDVIAYIADRDLRLCLTEKPDPNSYYFAGKCLAKLATLCWVLKDVLNNSQLLNLGLEKLKKELEVYVQNKPRNPLYYDDDWKGIVSNAGFESGPAADFGNTYYNDHHFHWAYFVYTAAVIGYLDPGWMHEGDHVAWTNMLVKDFAESDYKGRDFPFSRCFDWWHGHSWAKGLVESRDGKDVEGTGEDGWASYCVKMWGRVSGEAEMEKRGNLMLAIQARSFSHYFYMQDNNTTAPQQFVGNKISGISFENKVDYSTYRSPTPASISAFHLSPISPATSLFRSRAFIKEEWDTFFSDNRVLQVPGGARGVLMAGYAVLDPKTSWGFFRDGVEGSWDDRWVDDGSTRTWYCVWGAGLGGGR
ncbi:endo-1,3-beta-glucanase Engl1 [Clohesyomyces aquaticus]|uniref:glucan endo-1,3-beta-D-glucosidase n=1 Tax=Clohesyomyces aquaticus TaxID=1231657 RepID=A0A1Y1YFY3_9PLEO|nr:endo-1,3-beta-glucanase Engl1 [Clohesyomyces aquaticus]